MCTPAFQPLLLSEDRLVERGSFRGTPAQREILMVEFELKAAVAYTEGSGSIHILIPYSCFHSKNNLSDLHRKSCLVFKNLQMVWNFILDFHFHTLPKTYHCGVIRVQFRLRYFSVHDYCRREMYLSFKLSFSEPAVHIMLHPEHRKLPEFTKTKKKTFVACLNMVLCKYQEL